MQDVIAKIVRTLVIQENIFNQSKFLYIFGTYII